MGEAKKPQLKTVAKATLRHLRMSPRKVRLVVDQIRGLGVEDALATLRFMEKASAGPLEKLVRSAVANADQRGDVNIDNLRIGSMTVDGGKVIKRWRPRAQGRATPILKRTAHISVELGIAE